MWQKILIYHVCLSVLFFINTITFDTQYGLLNIGYYQNQIIQTETGTEPEIWFQFNGTGFPVLFRFLSG